MGEKFRRPAAAGLAVTVGSVLLAGCVFGAPTPVVGLSAVESGEDRWQLVAQELEPWAIDPVDPVGDTGRPAPERPAEQSSHLDCRVDRCVALTFDDGPSENTARLLDILSRADVPATFFVLGSGVAGHEAFAEAAAAQGEVASHGWSHTSLTDLTVDQIGTEIHRTDAIVSAATGRRPTMFRPPYGALSSSSTALLRRTGLPIVLWSVDPDDWRDRDADVVHRRVVDRVRPGSVVLMHDIYPTSVDAVPRIIEDLKAQGYHFVTVSQMWDGHLSPGVVHSGREADYQGE